MELLFVYGTLMRGFWNNDLIKSSKFIGKAKTNEKGWLYINTIPFLNFMEDGEYISGELYQVDEKTLDMIDDLEGHPVFYKREKTMVTLEYNNMIYEAWIYVWPEEIKDLEEKQSDYKNAKFLNRYLVFMDNDYVYEEFTSVESIKHKYKHMNINVYDIKKGEKVIDG